MDIEKIRSIPITDFLARLGHEPVKRRGNECWYSSPCRQERTPSFHVNEHKGVWHDFGTGHGGDIFSLAGEIAATGDFKEQAKFIADVYGNTLPDNFMPACVKTGKADKTQKTASCFENVTCGPLYDRVLLDYLKGRGIAGDIALPNCEEVRFRLHGKRYFAVGFRNLGGGIELRNRFMKWCIPPKDVSGIFNGSGTCNLFEGFIDYLSWMVLGISCGEDYLILNSVALLGRAYPYLDRYDRIRCYLDNDDAGKKTLEALRKRYGDRIDDCSDMYATYKDLNEYLQRNFPLE